jgi:FlaA1/EpsC-like NDP-sugar epimerase
MELDLCTLFPERTRNDFPNQKKLTNFHYKRTLITGGAGSIGSAVVKNLILTTNTEICIIDNDESRIHSLFQSFNSENQRRLKFYVTDIRDRIGIHQRIEAFNPDMIVHAAALKHVSILERQQRDAYLTNVIGTSHLIEYLEKNKAINFVFVSSDKAALPKSILGKTKLVGEYLVGGLIARDIDKEIKRNVSIVRFGNVFLSRGSVLETFISQISRNEPITITDPHMTRFFMDISDAAGLISHVMDQRIQGISIFKMGEPINIEELAKRLIRHLGGKNSEIRYIGMKPGEKLHEDLFSNIEISSIEDLGLILNSKKIFQVPNLEGNKSPVNDLEAIQMIDELLEKATPTLIQ